MSTARRLRHAAALLLAVAAAAPAAAQADGTPVASPGSLQPKYAPHQLVIESAFQYGGCSAPVRIAARLTKTGAYSTRLPVAGVRIRLGIYGATTPVLALQSVTSDAQGRVLAHLTPPADCKWNGSPVGNLTAGALVEYEYPMAEGDRLDESPVVKLP